MKVLVFLIGVLCISLLDKIYSIIASRFYARKCHYICQKCKMWSCINETENEEGNYLLGTYDNYKNVCGKEKNRGVL